MFRVWVACLLTLLSVSVYAKSIVVLGDSISAAYGIEVGQGWVALVQEKLNEKHKDVDINNESISGDTSAGGLARIDGALFRHKPAIVVIELGANDGLRGLPPAQMKSNLGEIIARVRKSGAKALLLSMRIPPNYGKRYTEAFYNVYPQLAQELNIPYVPFILEDVALVQELMQPDGLHPNAKAQPLIVEKIWPQLEKLL